MSQRQNSRNILSTADQRQYDDIIIHHVCHSLHLTQFEQQEAQYYQRNRTKLCREINWTAIDLQLGKSYATKSFAYKRFFDVILPNLLPSYPHEIVVQIEKYIQEQVSVELSKLQEKAGSQGVNELVKKISKQTKDKFNLQGSDQYSYKKEVDRINYYIKKCINDPQDYNQLLQDNNQVIFQIYQHITELNIQNDNPINVQTESTHKMDEIQIFVDSPLELADLTLSMDFQQSFNFDK
ncbi:Hypothetical_protein [Hexamita inflata]|uniref:Hypothetical_protein n=1 Tax=Hexamita inflata TaxID=28002 RepID=A0ABP1GHA5_9EUKA